MKAEQLTELVTLYEGDALDVLRTLGRRSAAAIVTDPPYCSGAATEAGRGAATHQGLRSETVKGGRFNWFDADNWLMRSVCVEAARILPAAGSVLAFCDWRMLTSLAPAMESAGFRQRNLIVWDKGHFGCGTGFRPQHELVIHLTKRAPKFHAKDVGNVITSKRVRSADRDHAAEKPVDVMADLIRVASARGDTVIDPFAGSGTTAEAAAKLGRRCILIESDPAACEAIRKRAFRVDGRAPGNLFEASE